MGENIAFAQVLGSFCHQCLLLKLLMVCHPVSLQATPCCCPLLLQILFIFIILFQLPSLLTGSYPVLFEVIYQSCWTSVLVYKFSFSAMLPVPHAAPFMYVSVNVCMPFQRSHRVK